MATKTAMHQDIRSLFQTGSAEATVRRPLVRGATAISAAALVSLVSRGATIALARYVRHSLAKVLEQQLITRL
jgi:hypothetical protein